MIKTAIISMALLSGLNNGFQNPETISGVVVETKYNQSADNFLVVVQTEEGYCRIVNDWWAMEGTKVNFVVQEDGKVLYCNSEYKN